MFASGWENEGIRWAVKTFRKFTYAVPRFTLIDGGLIEMKLRTTDVIFIHIENAIADGPNC